MIMRRSAPVSEREFIKIEAVKVWRVVDGPHSSTRRLSISLPRVRFLESKPRRKTPEHSALRRSL